MQNFSLLFNKMARDTPAQVLDFLRHQSANKSRSMLSKDLAELRAYALSLQMELQNHLHGIFLYYAKNCSKHTPYS